MQVKEENDTLICLKHNKKIKMFIMDNQVPFSDALICTHCLQEKPTISNKIIAIAQAQKMITEKYSSQIFDGEELQFLNGLQQLSNQVLEYKNKVLQQTDVILSVLAQWITDIKGQRTQPLKLIQELQKLHSNFEVKQKDNQQIEKINEAHITKLQTQFQQLQEQDLVVSFKQQIEQLSSKIKLSKLTPTDVDIKIVQLQDQQKLTKPLFNVPKKIDLVNTEKQPEYSCAIAFNKDGSLMVAGSYKDIKVWQFNKGKLTQLKTLKAHTQYVYSLVFSKKINWFASSSEGMLIGWKEQKNEWINTQPQQKHTSFINCIILNINENELISCGSDKSIIVWNVDCQKNQIQYNYTLKNKHTEQIYCISLNYSETALVSCSDDQTIILWMKGQNSKWEYSNQIKISRGFRIGFISDTQIFFQPRYIDKTLIIQIENQKLVELENLKIKLNEANYDDNLFPTIYNKQRQLIIQKHSNYVYIIQGQIDGSFKIVLEPIDCQHFMNFGALTDNGDYLVIWNNQTVEFRVYQISY